MSRLQAGAPSSKAVKRQRLDGARPIDAEEERSPSSLLQDDIKHFASLTDSLFKCLESPQSFFSDSTASATSSGRDQKNLRALLQASGVLGTSPAYHLTSTLSSLQTLDDRIQCHLTLAREHAANQEKIEMLQAQLKIREERTKSAISELARMKMDLDKIVRWSQEESKRIQQAESSKCNTGTES